MSHPEDQVLIRRALAGDQTAFKTLYQAYHPQIYATLARRTADRDLVDDLVQLTFVRAFRSLKAFRGDAAFSTWLTQIALNVYRSHLRAQRVRRAWAAEAETAARVSGPEPDAAAPETPERAVLRAEHRTLVRKGIQALPQRYREAVWLRYVREWSYEEITQTMHIPMGTLKTWLCRARRQLKGEFRKLGLQAI